MLQKMREIGETQKIREAQSEKREGNAEFSFPFYSLRSPRLRGGIYAVFDITLTTSPDYVRIAQSLIPTHFSTLLWSFRPGKFDYLITYLITIYYYVDYLPGRSKNLKTENWKRKTEIP
jgi:hypothetical protein